MKAVITGDIINSRKVSSSLWMKDLKSVFERIWQRTERLGIYRGDSFQLVVDPADARDSVATKGYH
jgi:uncharacterized BrkB/YihY/UPF0761 family membrane protein